MYLVACAGAPRPPFHLHRSRLTPPRAPYSKYPPVAKDLSFWLPAGAAAAPAASAAAAAGGPPAAAAAATAAAAAAAADPTVAVADADDPWREVGNSVCKVVRGVAGDWAEAVTRVGEPFTRNGATSLCYRVTYQSMDRSLTHAEVDAVQARVRAGVVAAMGVRLR